MDCYGRVTILIIEHEMISEGTAPCINKRTRFIFAGCIEYKLTHPLITISKRDPAFLWP